MIKGFLIGLVAASLGSQQLFAADDAAQLSNLGLPVQRSADVPAAIDPKPAMPERPRRVGFEREQASSQARQLAEWVIDSGDNRSLPFAIVDKTDAKVFVFYADGRLRGSAPALLGLAPGDDSVPGIGSRKLSSVRPDQRTTPAGRFVAALGSNLHGEEILWVDYDAAVSMHRVITTKPEERRLQRLATPTPLDNRITYGCINVPAKFYDRVVSPAFTGTDGIVYVLPETRSSREVFASYDVDLRTQLKVAGHSSSTQILPPNPLQ